MKCEDLILICYFFLIHIFLSPISCNRCYEISSHELPQYKLIRANAHSNQAIISRMKVGNLSQCAEFASSKRALAFNFNSGDNYDVRFWDATVNERNRAGNRGLQGKMCQALECPETINSTTLLREQNSRYYSLYPNYIRAEFGSLACVPRVGVFMFSNSALNYTQAQLACQKINGSLAHIISEERTNNLAKYIDRKMPSFVGLSNRGGERIWKNEFDEPLSCFKYRAWGEKEPSHSRGCVALVQALEVNSPPFWKVAPCSTPLPFVCEISPYY